MVKMEKKIETAIVFRVYRLLGLGSGGLSIQWYYSFVFDSTFSG